MKDYQEKPGEFGKKLKMGLIKRILKNVLRGYLPGVVGVFLLHSAAHAVSTVQRVDLDVGGTVLGVGLSRRTAFKTLQLDAREIMVAFKSADLAPSAAGSRSGTGIVKQFSLEKLADRVVSLTIDTTTDIREVQAEWQGDTTILLVRLLPLEVPDTAEVPVKHRRFKKEAATESGDESRGTEIPGSSGESARELTSETELSVRQEKETVRLPEAFSGDLALASVGAQASLPSEETGLSGFLAEVARSDCAASPILAEALALCRKNEWEKAFSLLDSGIDPASVDACQAGLYYFRAFSSYKMNSEGNDRLYLDAVSCFQDALSYYPDTPYAPFAMLALATVYDKLNSNAEAKGYFKLILKTYSEHSVAADALLGLGDLYAKEGKQAQAISTYRQYMKSYPQSSRLAEVRFALGKSLYELGEFAKSLDMLSQVVEEDPRRVYEDPNLLIYIGKLNYQLNDMDSAREAMTKAVNLYPDNDEVPLLLAKIGDTLKDEGREDQAKKVYELVMKTYPDTDGYAISAIRRADLLSDRYTKEAQYRMVIERFAGQPMEKLATIRLANLQYKEEKYSAGIETLRDLMSGNLKELKNEAEFLIASCFDGYFRQLADRNDPLAIITAYEKDKTLINRFDNPDMFETAGEAFYQTKFYTQAEELFQDAYNLSTPENRPASLYYRLAVTLQELGKNMQAREMFHAYFRKLPENEIDPDAYLRMGRLLAADESWETALGFIESGFQKSESDMQKAAFLMLRADVYRGMGREETVPDLLIKAINLMASSPEASNERLIQAYRSLGESYVKLSLYGKGSDAFTMALNYSGDSRPSDLLFLLAESDYKARNLEAARAVLTEIVSAGDEFWVRMAEEQLRTMALEEKLGRRVNSEQ